MASTVLPNGIIVPEKFSRDWYADLYHNWQELDNLLGGGTPKDGTLTIQKNGDTVGTFSANQATDETVNGVSTTYDIHDANAVDLTNNQTVGGNKEFTGTTTAHDVIPGATDTYNLGSPSYQWNNAYIKSLTINGVACGDILTHNVSEFVDVSGNQTIGGQKIFSNASTGLGKDVYHFATIPYGKNTPPVTTSTQYIYFSGNTASQGFANGWFSGYIEQTVQANGGSRCRWLIRNTDEKNASVELLSAGNTLAFRPSVDNVMLLGLNSHKWKDCNTYAINGLNPGALSLPDNSKSVVIDTTNWDVAGGTNVYTPPANGWLHIRVTDATELAVRWTDWRFGDRRVSATATDLGVTIPVVAGVTIDVITVASGFNSKCQFFPCQGNV